MSTEEKTREKGALTVSLLSREFRVACPEGEEKQLLASADYLNRKLKEAVAAWPGDSTTIGDAASSLDRLEAVLGGQGEHCEWTDRRSAGVNSRGGCPGT